MKTNRPAYLSGIILCAAVLWVITAAVTAADPANTQDTVYVDHVLVNNSTKNFSVEGEIPPGFSYSGNGTPLNGAVWGGSAAYSGAFPDRKSTSGAMVLYANRSGAWVRWQPLAADMVAGAEYELFVYNICRTDEHGNWDTNVQYEIYANGVSSIQNVNQKTATGTESGWYSLGKYVLKGDGSDYIKLTRTNPDTNKATMADAAKFVRIGGPALADGFYLDSVAAENLTPNPLEASASGKTVIARYTALAPGEDAVMYVGLFEALNGDWTLSRISMSEALENGGTLEAALRLPSLDTGAYMLKVFVWGGENNPIRQTPVTVTEP